MPAPVGFNFPAVPTAAKRRVCQPVVEARGVEARRCPRLWARNRVGVVAAARVVYRPSEAVRSAGVELDAGDLYPRRVRRVVRDLTRTTSPATLVPESPAVAYPWLAVVIQRDLGRVNCD